MSFGGVGIGQKRPIYRHPAGFWFLSRYEDVASALKDADTFSSAAMGGGRRPAGMPQRGETAIGNSLISEDPPVHTQQRNVVNRGFTPGRIAALEPRIEQLADELFEEFAGRGHCDVTTEFANPLPVSVIAELLGLRRASPSPTSSIWIGTHRGTSDSGSATTSAWGRRSRDSRARSRCRASFGG